MFPIVTLCIMLVQISFISPNDVLTSAAEGGIIARNIYKTVKKHLGRAYETWID